MSLAKSLLKENIVCSEPCQMQSAVFSQVLFVKPNVAGLSKTRDI